MNMKLFHSTTNLKITKNLIYDFYSITIEKKIRNF